MTDQRVMELPQAAWRWAGNEYYSAAQMYAYAARVAALEGAMADKARLDSGRIILNHAPDEWGNTRTEFTGVNLRAAIDSAGGGPVNSNNQTRISDEN